MVGREGQSLSEFTLQLQLGNVMCMGVGVAGKGCPWKVIKRMTGDASAIAINTLHAVILSTSSISA